jgi:lipopolysaccharide/colanic/teichoic acid biosynthesis glycosyltransferase
MFEFIHYAQINGGQRAGAEEKGTLKERYIQNASFWLYIRIILRMGRERSDSKHASRPCEVPKPGRTGHNDSSN